MVQTLFLFWINQSNLDCSYYEKGCVELLNENCPFYCSRKKGVRRVMGLIREARRSILILDWEVHINEKAILHLLHVLGSLVDTNHAYHHD